MTVISKSHAFGRPYHRHFTVFYVSFFYFSFFIFFCITVHAFINSWCELPGRFSGSMWTILVIVYISWNRQFAQWRQMALQNTVPDLNPISALNPMWKTLVYRSRMPLNILRNGIPEGPTAETAPHTEETRSCILLLLYSWRRPFTLYNSTD